MNKKQKQKAIIKKQDEIIEALEKLRVLDDEPVEVGILGMAQYAIKSANELTVAKRKKEINDLKATPVDKKCDSDLIYDAFNKAVVSLSEVTSVDGSTKIDELVGKYESEIFKNQEVPDLFKGYEITFSLDKAVTIKLSNDGKLLSIEKE